MRHEGACVLACDPLSHLIHPLGMRHALRLLACVDRIGMLYHHALYVRTWRNTLLSSLKSTDPP